MVRLARDGLALGCLGQETAFLKLVKFLVFLTDPSDRMILYHAQIY